MTAGFTESEVEEAALGWLATLGFAVKHGPAIAFDADGGERSDPGYRDTILQNRLHRALSRLNGGLPPAAIGSIGTASADPIAQAPQRLPRARLGDASRHGRAAHPQAAARQLFSGFPRAAAPR